MSLYNTLFGVNPCAGTLLKMIGADIQRIPRFRDCFLKGNAIVIYTRTGGPNRFSFEAENARLRQVPGFLADHDDAFDSTFAYFAYAIPEQYAMTAEILREHGAGRDPAVEWPRLLAKIKDPAMADDPEVIAAMERMRPTMEKVAAAIKGDGSPIVLVDGDHGLAR